jgi:hypothetical protein
MCGRYTLTADLKKVAERFGAPMPLVLDKAFKGEL